MDLRPQERPSRPGHARWLRRGLAGTMIGLGAGVTVLALNLPAGGVQDADPRGPFAGSTAPEQHTEVAPPVVRTVTTGTTAFSAPGGTP